MRKLRLRTYETLEKSVVILYISRTKFEEFSDIIPFCSAMSRGPRHVVGAYSELFVLTNLRITTTDIVFPVISRLLICMTPTVLKGSKYASGIGKHRHAGMSCLSFCGWLLKMG